MSQQQHGVAGLKKHDIKVSGIPWVCNRSSRSFGIIKKQTDFAFFVFSDDPAKVTDIVGIHADEVVVGLVV